MQNFPLSYRLDLWVYIANAPAPGPPRAPEAMRLVAIGNAEG